MTFMKLGFRSLFRQKRRTLITLMVITFGIGCLLLTTGHSVYIEWALRESTIHSETGHLQLFHPEYFQQEEETILQYGLDNYEMIGDDLMRNREVMLVQARIDFMGLISNGDKSVAFMGKGVEPNKEKKLRNLFGNSGADYDSLIANQPDTDIIILGQGLAASLDAEKGDWLTLMSTTADGALNAVDVRVVDTFNGGMAEYDKRALMIPLKTAQILLNSQKVKKLLVTLDDTEKTDQMYDRISHRAEKQGYAVSLKKWHQQAAYYRQVSRFYHQITGFLSLVLFIIVFFSTSNTVVMSIVERTREIGTLLSLGTSRWQTLKMFFFEGLQIGIIGGFLSCVFALGCSIMINHFQIVLSPPPGFTEGYPLSIRVQADFYIQIFLVTVIVATFSSLAPVFRVTRMKIVDALGHV
ncbi:MAG: FtsX-like permease family protein [bacterium]